VTRLSQSERERYARQIEEIGEEAQERLKQARAIVVGAGRVGVAAAAELASRGVGYIGIVDGGTIALGDLVGQAVYYTPDVGRGKADTLAAKLGLLNPDVHAEAYPVDLEPANAAAIVAGLDLVLDCTHRDEVAEALASTGTPVLHGAAEAVDALAGAPVEASS
jgi:molybdopterin/thiamine biosynthesis adenylyltransferase